MPSSHQTLTPPEAPCGDRYVWCRDCGLTVRSRCRRNRCAWCGPINARQAALAIASAGPERSYLLTLVGTDWQEVRKRVFRFRYFVRQTAGKGWHDCWHVEPNPSGSGEHHVHGLAWGGSFVRVEAFRSAAVRSGCGSWVGLRRIRSESAASFYGVKLAALAASAYSVKGAGGDLETFLDANGGRVVHASRGFWRDGAGSSLPGIRAAVAAARGRVGVARCPVSGERHAWDGEGFGRGTGPSRTWGLPVSDGAGTLDSLVERG